MNMKLRFVLAVALFAAVVIAGTGAPAWADKLNIGSQAPAAAVPAIPLEAGARAPGSVAVGPLVIPVTGAEAVLVGSCAWVQVISPPPSVNYSSAIVPDSQIPKEDPAKLVSCAVRVDAVTSTGLGALTQVCWAKVPNQTLFGYYWDGTKWVKTTLVSQVEQATKAEQVCVMVPATASNPAYAALFNQ